MKRLRVIGAVAVVVTSLAVGVLVTIRSNVQPVEVDGAVEAAVKPTFELAPDKQKFIWDVEHLTFELETKLGKPLVKSLAQGKQEEIVSFLRDGFRAVVLTRLESERRAHSVVSETIITNTSQNVRQVDGAAFAAELVEGLSEFGVVERSRLRVLTMDQDAGDASAWKSDFLLTADGKNQDGHPIHWESMNRVSLVVSSADVSDTPVLQEWVVQSETTRNSLQPLLDEITQSAGLSDLPIWDNWNLPTAAVEQYRLQSCVADYDRDGYPDIAVASIEGRPLLLKSVNGESYRDVVYSMGIRAWQSELDTATTLAAWIDFNNDAFPDLILGNHVYRNDSGNKFVEVTKESNLTFERDPMGCAVADYDCDGDLDLYILYQSSESGHSSETVPWVGDTMSGRQNEMWQNDGAGVFRNVTEECGAGGGARHSFAATWFFYDDDHYPDLYIANDFGANVLFRNRGDGTFEDVSENTGVSDFATSMGVCTGDLDNDGNSEIYVANMYSKMGRRIIGQVCDEDYPRGIFPQIQGSCTGNRLYTRKGSDTTYQENSEQLHVNAVGWAYAPAVVDLDSDGWLDIYATTGFLSFDRRKPDG